MEGVLFSVVISTFNRPERLRECIQSVLREFDSSSLVNEGKVFLELIVVEDGSCSFRILPELSSHSVQIRYFRTFRNEGANLTRVHGIRRAQGEFIVFLDDDDLWRSGRLNELYFYHIGNRSDIHFARYKIRGSLRSSFIGLVARIFSNKDILSSNFLGGFSIFSVRRKTMIENINFLEAKLPSCQDWYLYINLFNESGLVKSFGKSKTVDYMVHKSGNITASLEKRLSGVNAILKLLSDLGYVRESRTQLIVELLILRRQVFKSANWRSTLLVLKYGSVLAVIKILRSLFK